MLSTPSGEDESSNYTNSTKTLNRALLSSPSNSSSQSSSPSPFSPLALHSHPTTTTNMEEVWKDISLASLHDRPSINDSATAFSGGLTFQDFLSRPLGKNPPPTAVASGGGGYGSPEASPPAIGLSLNSGPDRFSLLGNCDENPFRTDSMLEDRPISNDIVSSLNVMSFDGLASSSLGKKRFSESDTNSGDRRHKRMIKNRESAARSRARKQAYTNELELEVAHLMEENARLKRQLYLAAAAQVPKKRSLHRTSTAPF